MDGFINYLKATRGELKHVSWPTQRQTSIFTALVIGLSILTGLYLGFFDHVFTLLLDRFFI
ncbi:preprotein translocase subunit SecE [Patescibacteria group bacterium]|jgi:preprotein translocase SecE subunit|nr:preprotein translocase subunit SecE [Patescibacteria group bacterium]